MAETRGNPVELASQFGREIGVGLEYVNERKGMEPGQASPFAHLHKPTAHHPPRRLLSRSPQRHFHPQASRVPLVVLATSVRKF